MEEITDIRVNWSEKQWNDYYAWLADNVLEEQSIISWIETWADMTNC
jgi:hypothetical protein